MSGSDTRSPETVTPGPNSVDLAMMRRALALADQAAALGEVPVGAVVYRTSDAKVMGEGFNRREIDKNPSSHAEFSAILAACEAIGDWRLNDCSLAVTLEPCPMCAGLIVNARVGRVLFGADDPKAGACRSLFAITSDARLNHRAEMVAGLLAEEASQRLRVFFRTLRGKEN
jgi:tRNA(Arg) A34 adenosine deaminase TadA